MAEVAVQIEGRTLNLSNLDKVLYPDTGFTKAQVVDYYARIAPTLLPHLVGRPLTLVRYPDGVAGKSFFEKRRPPSAPDWVEVGGELGSVLCEEPATLVWLANLAALELHTHQHTVAAPDLPTAVVLDLDPGPPATVVDCARVALELRSLLDRLGLTSVVKTSGSKGLHVSVPIATGTATDDDTKGFALALGRILAESAPKRVTVTMAKEQRGGKVFVDWSQNDRHKTTVAPYSLRARPRPTVSTPVTWDEVARAIDESDPRSLTFETDAVLERVAQFGDLYAANLASGQTLPALA
ncbi:MAG: non-homologous end-joining DNA ligase [Acidimicrobiia bacterium]|nr:non-homologous end-joining DNA ligase [Acidimicrobiia bacterium]